MMQHVELNRIVIDSNSIIFPKRNTSKDKIPHGCSMSTHSDLRLRKIRVAATIEVAAGGMRQDLSHDKSKMVSV